MANCASLQSWLRPSPAHLVYCRRNNCPVPFRRFQDLVGDFGPYKRRGVVIIDLKGFVHAHHHRPLGRMHVQADSVSYLLDEQRIPRQLKGIATVEFEGESLPDPAYPMGRVTTPSVLRSKATGEPDDSACDLPLSI